MGVRGLTTFIAKNSDQYFEEYELHDCSLVIDGNNLAAQLYKHVSKCNSGFGGDYDKYYNCVVNFFDLLKSCKVQPYVLFDGGYETRKKKSVYSRLIAKQSAAQILCPANQSLLQIFPLMMRDVLRDALRDLHITFMQCDFEADDEISDIAREISCPVLSNDSDFYIYNVEYIPFSTLNLNILKSTTGYQYLPCKIYRIETFVNSFGGLKKELLPLLATLLGNDYISRSTFKCFYAHLKLQKTKKKISDQQRTIAALLQWLRNETYESAVEKILSRLKMSDRPKVLKQISNSVRGYLEGTNNASILLGIRSSTISSFTNTSGSELARLINSELTYFLDNLYISDSKTGIEEKCIEDEICHIPSWFRYLYNKGTFPSYFMDFIIHDTVYSNPQIEDIKYPDTNTIALPIFAYIFRIINHNRESFTYVGRNDHNHITKHKIEVLEKYQNIDFPKLSVFNQLYPHSDLFYNFMKETSGDKNFDSLKIVPANLHLYIICIYWFSVNINEPKLLASHIHSLILCLVYLQFIDPIVEKCRSFIKLKTKYESMTTFESSTKPELTWETFFLSHEIPIKECYASSLNLVTYFKLDEKLKISNKLFSRRLVHTFSMFQNVVQQMNVLNSLLGFPFMSCRIHEFYNGTFIYNAHNHLKSRSNILSYIQLLLKDAPCLFNNYKNLYSVLKELLPDILDESQRRKRHKHKNKKVNVSTIESTYSDSNSENENIGADVKNNVYWILNNIKD